MFEANKWPVNGLKFDDRRRVRMSNYLENLRNIADSIFPTRSGDQLLDAPSSLENSGTINLDEIWEEATNQFIYNPELSKEKYHGRGSYEVFDMKGIVPGIVEYEVDRPIRGVQLKPEDIEGTTFAHCRIRFYTAASTTGHEQLLHQAAKDTETEILEINEPEFKHFPQLPAEFYLEPDKINQIPQAHQETAKLLKNMYQTHLTKIIKDLEEAEYCEGAREKEEIAENEEGQLESNLTPEEDKYAQASQRFITECPNLIQIAELQALSLT